jgi:hypothetical protein
MAVVKNLGTGGSALDAQYGPIPAPNTNAPLLLDPETSGNFVYLPGSAGNYVAVPHAPELNILGTEGTPFLSLPGVVGSDAFTSDSVALDITGDIDLRCLVELDSWSSSSVLVSKQNNAPNRGYELNVVAGSLGVAWSEDGTVVLSAFSTVVVPAQPAGTRLWLRGTLDVDNGAGGRTATFFTSTDGTTWTQLGAQVVQAGVTSIVNNDSRLSVGARGNAGAPSAGKFYRAIVRNGIGGTTVFDADFTQQALGSRGFIDSTNKLVSITGNAAQIVDGTTYGFSPGVAGAYWSTPDVAALDITGDIDLRAQMSLNDWTPAAINRLVTKWQGGSTFSYAIYVQLDGKLVLQWSPDGTIPSILTATSSVTTGLADGATKWVRGTLDVDDGAGNRVANFYLSDDGTTWTQLGTTITTAGATSIFASTSQLEIGAGNSGFSQASGRVLRAQVFNGIAGTKVFDADFTRQLQFASSFTENTGKVVTTNGTARIERERNLEIVARVAMDDWTPGTIQTLVAKDDGALRQYRLLLNTSGALALVWYPTGLSASAVVATSSVSVGAADGATLWVKATLDVFVGTGNVVTFYTAPDSLTEPLVWIPLGTAITTTGATSIAPSTPSLAIGMYSDGATGPLAGKVWHTIIRNGINGPAVLDLDFTDMVTTGDETAMLSTGPGSPTIPEALRVAPNLGWGGTALNARYGSTVAPNSNEPLLLGHTGENYLYLPGGTISANFASVPAAVGSPLDITGDVAIAVHVDRELPSEDRVLLIRRQGGVDSAFFSYLFGQWNAGGGVFLKFQWVDAAGASFATYGTVTVPRTTQHVGVTHVVDNGAGQNVVSFYGSTDGTTWTLIQSITNAGTTSHRSNAAQVGIGGTNTGDYGAVGSYYRARIWDAASFAGAPVFDADFTSGITSGAQTTFTESSSNAATVTINRSTAGRKACAVVRPTWLLGTDDFFEVADNALLDFGAGDDFTVVAVVRQWGTGGSFMAYASKQNPDSNSNVGWGQVRNTGAATSLLDLKDGSGVGSGTAFAQAYTSGAVSVLSSQREGAVARHQLNNATPTTGTASTLTFANSLPMRIGANPAGAPFYADMELLAVAVFRRALTAGELATVSTHYQTAPSAASTALMRQSVFWVDAATRSVAQINRSSSGRKSVAVAKPVWLLGTDDFFEVPDNALLDFGASDSFTVVAVVRQWATPVNFGRYVEKRQGGDLAGYGVLALGTTLGRQYLTIDAGPNGTDTSSGALNTFTAGQLVAISGVRDTVADTIRSFNNGLATASTAVTDTTTGSLANTGALRIGGSSTGFGNQDFECYAVAVFRRALTATELSSIAEYYGAV